MVYLDEPLGDDSESSAEPQSLHDIIGKEGSQDTELEARQVFKMIESSHPEVVTRAILLRAEGLSYEEIGEQIGKSKEAVKKMFLRMYANRVESEVK